MNESFDKNTKQEKGSSIHASQIYDVLTSLVMHSEQVRWTRLNTFLVVSSIFFAIWAGIFVGTDAFDGKKYLLSMLCVPNIILGVIWSFLGWRSSLYMNDFHDCAYVIEDIEFSEGQPKPFHISEERRSKLRDKVERFTSSKWLVTYVPIIFSIFFLFLATVSFILEPGKGKAQQESRAGIISGTSVEVPSIEKEKESSKTGAPMR